MACKRSGVQVPYPPFETRFGAWTLAGFFVGGAGLKVRWAWRFAPARRRQEISSPISRSGALVFTRAFQGIRFEVGGSSGVLDHGLEPFQACVIVRQSGLGDHAGDVRDRGNS